MIKFDMDDMKLIYDLVVQETGGSAGIRDVGLVKGSISNIYQTFGGVELYPTIEEKGAMLGFSLMKNHAFLDGNKRVSMLCMLTFLEANGVSLGYSDDVLYNLAIGLADGTLDYDYLVNWIKRHKLNDYEVWLNEDNVIYDTRVADWDSGAVEVKNGCIKDDKRN